MLRHLYLALKTRSNIVVRHLINLAYQLYEYSFGVKSHILRASICHLASFTLITGTFWLHFPRLEAVRICDEQCSLIYVGKDDDENDGTDKLDILQALFPKGYRETDLGRVAVWKLADYSQQWLQENDLVVSRVSRFFPWQIPANYAFDNPLRVNQIVRLNNINSIEDFMSSLDNKKYRQYVHQMLDEHYTTRFTHSLDDLQYFYQHMYLPTTQLRHGKFAVVAPFEALKKVMDRGGVLMMLELEGQEVGGALCLLTRQGDFQGEFLGYLDGSEALVKRHVGLALYWYSIKYAIEQHASAFNFMASVAWVSNGVFFYKQRWGAKVSPEPYVGEKILVRANTLSPFWREHLNQVGFITEADEGFLRVYLDLEEAASESAYECAVKNGLVGIQVVRSGQHQNYLKLPAV